MRLHEKGGKAHEMPCHHQLDESLHAYLERAGLVNDDKGYLFRSLAGKTGQLTERPLGQSDVHRMIRRRAEAADILTAIGCHSFRATGITEYLRNGGKLEVAQQMANHESARTTGLYDRRQDQINLEEAVTSRGTAWSGNRERLLTACDPTKASVRSVPSAETG